MNDIMDVVRALDEKSDEIIGSISRGMREPETSAGVLAQLYEIAHRYASILEHAIDTLENQDADEDDVELAEALCERFGDLSIELAAMLRDRR